MTQTPFEVQAASGKLTDFSVINKFGRNTDIDTTEEDIWDGGGTWAAPTAARVHAIVSSSADDDGSPAGTGARTVVVIGLDSNWAVAEETVTLNGTGAVNTSGSYHRIYRMYVATAGSGGSNAGTITATAATDSTVTAQIGIGNNQTLMAIYTVPASNTGYLWHYYASVAKLTSATVDVKLYVRPFGGVWQLKHVTTVKDAYLHHDFDFPLKIDAKSDIKIACPASTNNVDVCAGFDILLDEN